MNEFTILKNRDVTLPTKAYIVKVMVFPVVMYRCECWTIKLSAEELMLLFYFIFKLYIIVLVLPNIKMNPPQVY